MPGEPGVMRLTRGQRHFRASFKYYGTEQGFSGHGGDNQMREAMFAKATAGRNLLNTQCTIYQEITKIAEVMRRNAPLRFGRMYYRQISGTESISASRSVSRIRSHGRAFCIPTRSWSHTMWPVSSGMTV
jgi:hypothetical protein